jgi:hypothetical protein
MYCLTNGTLISVSDSRKENNAYCRTCPSSNYLLYAEKDGKRVGFLVVKNGLNMQTTYTGDIDIKIASGYAGLGLERVFIRQLKQWIFHQSKTTKKANFKVQVDELLELEFLIDIRDVI